MLSGLKNYYINYLKSRENKGRVIHTHSQVIPVKLLLDVAPSSSMQVFVEDATMGCTRAKNRPHGIGYFKIL